MDGEEVEGHHNHSGAGQKQQRQGELMKGCIKDHKGKMVAYFDPDHVLFALKLSGPPIGPITRESVLKARPESLPFSIFAQWAADELDKWNLKREMQNLLADRDVNHGDNSDDDDASSATLDTSDDEEADPDFVMGNDGGNNVGPGVPPKEAVNRHGYTKAEMAFVKAHFKTLWKFLHLYGLKIDKDKDVELGRDILRAMMAKEQTKKSTNTKITGFAARVPRRQPQSKVVKRSGPRPQRVNKNGGLGQNSFLTATLGKYRVTRAPRTPQRRMGSSRATVIKQESA